MEENGRGEHDRIEPVHAVTYFAPEARAALDDLARVSAEAGLYDDDI